MTMMTCPSEPSTLAAAAVGIGIVCEILAGGAGALAMLPTPDSRKSEGRLVAAATLAGFLGILLISAVVAGAIR